MYKTFFKLASDPFKLTPDTGCFFFEGQRKAILDALLYAIVRGDGLIKVVGEVGSGKTILSRMLIQSLPEHFETVYLVNPRIPPDQILQAIALELKLDDVATGKAGLLNRLQKKLLAIHARQKQTVLLIDEAQAMPLETLEEIRMLSNLETGQDKLLQIVLFGQPELDQKLNQHCVRQIKDRIIHHFYLPVLNRQEVGRYLFFRLQAASFKGEFPFSVGAVALIAWQSGGILRKINVLAEKCLLAAYCKQRHRVGVLTVFKVWLEHNNSRRWKAGAGLIAVTLLLAGWPADVQFMPEHLPVLHRVDRNAIRKDVPPHQDQTVKAGVQKTLPQKSESEKQTMASAFYVIKLLSIRLKPRQQAENVLKQMIPRRYRANMAYKVLDERWCEVFLGPFVQVKTAQEKLESLPAFLKRNQPYLVKIPATNWQGLNTLQ